MQQKYHAVKKLIYCIAIAATLAPGFAMSADYQTETSVQLISPFRLITHTQVLIDAPLEKVWDIATDFENMGDWNTQFEKIVGDTRDGGDIVAYLNVGGKVRPIPHKFVYVEGKRFGWREAFPDNDDVHDNHMIYFVPVGKDKTLVIQSDDMTATSVANPLGPISKVIGSEYEGLPHGLKAHIENMQ